METVELQDFYSGGYFLIRANHPGWDQLKSELIPEQLISLSNCICPKFNVNWGWTTGDKQTALDFGIDKNRLEEFLDWCGHEYKETMDMWSMFYTSNDVRQFINRFHVHTEKLYIIGAALPRSIEEIDWQESDDDAYGIEKRIEQHLPIESGGETLGFEVVSFEYSSFGHSWLCHYLHEDVNRTFGIRPNRYGLFQTLGDAMTVLKWIQAGGDEGRAHHLPYDVWQLLSYPLEVGTSP